MGVEKMYILYKMYNYTTLYYNYTLRIIILYNCIVYNLYIELALGYRNGV